MRDRVGIFGLEILKVADPLVEDGLVPARMIYRLSAIVGNCGNMEQKYCGIDYQNPAE